jgi:hypothetical protein
MSERDALLPGAPEPSFNIDNQGQQQQQPQQQQQLLQRQQNAPAEAPNLNESVPGPSRPAVRSPERSDTDNSSPEFRLDRNPDEGGSGNPEQVAAAAAAAANTTTPASGKTILPKNDARANKLMRVHLQHNETCSILESNRYSSECKKVWFDHDYASQKVSKDKKGKSKSSAGRGGGRSQPRNAAAAAEEEDDDDEDEQNAPTNDAEAATSDLSLEESDFSSAESTTDVSSEHSDWGSDDSKKDNATPTAASTRRRRRSEEAAASGKKKSPRHKKKRSAALKCREDMLRHPGDITEEYIPSPWLSESMPRKSPYCPQIGDVLVCFK